MSDATFEQVEGIPARAAPKAAVKALAPALPRGEDILPDGRQDWQILISPGHVIGHRLMAVGRRRFLPAVVATVVGGFLTFSAVFGGIAGFGGAPASVRRALTTDPAHYAVLPGYEERGNYRLAWLAGAVGTPQRGLTEEGWGALFTAALHDIEAHADKVDDYAELPKLQKQATVTRPEKVLSEHAGDLQNGVLALPKADPTTTAILAAFVEGKLRIVNLHRGPYRPECRVVLGPPIPGCDPVITADFNSLRPEGK
jgi:hypothetical protein